MSIVVQCPGCTETLEAPDTAAGKGCPCPICQAVVAVPLAAELTADRWPRRRRFECPHCGTHEPPERTRQISTAGWVIFAVFLAFFFPLFWVGLLITEPVEYCYDCGKRLACRSC